MVLIIGNRSEGASERIDPVVHSDPNSSEIWCTKRKTKFSLLLSEKNRSDGMFETFEAIGDPFPVAFQRYGLIC